MSNVAKATIYNYFGGKDQVIVEVLNREIVEFSSRVSDTVAQKRSPLDKLRTFIFTTFQMIREKADLLNMHADIFERVIPGAGGIQKDLFKKQAATLQAILKEGMKKGIFMRADPTTTRSILFAMRGIEFTWLLNRDSLELENDLDALFKLLCSGILKNKETVHA